MRDNGDALWETQRGLSGSVTPELRAVDVKYIADSDIFYFRVYYDGKVNEKQIDLWECVLIEACADCNNLDAEIIRLDYPKAIPRHGKYAYLRKEPPVTGPVVPCTERLSIQREFVHFQHEIGLFVSPDNDRTMPTRWGIAHIDEKGIHVFPAKPEALEIDIVPVAYAQLALQRALLGTVVPALIAILVDVKETELYIHFHYEGAISKETVQDWERVMTKTWADFGPNYVLNGKIESVVYPNPIFIRGRGAYRRREPRGSAPWPYVSIESVENSP